MEWITALQTVLGVAVVVVGWLIIDRVKSIDQSIAATRADLKAHIDKEILTLREVQAQIDRESMERDNALTRDLNTLRTDLPQQYIMRAEFERSMQSLAESINGVNRKVDQVLDVLLNRK